MNEFDLEKYQEAWKRESAFRRQVLSEEEIRGFMRSESRGIARYLKTGLYFDIALKSILALAFGWVMALYAGSNGMQPIFGLGILLTAAGILYQLRILRGIPVAGTVARDTRSMLRNYLGFYHKKYVRSIFVSAASVSLVIVCGSLAYFYYKYGGLPSLGPDDYAVFALLISIGFVFSAAVQWQQSALRIRQLEDCLRQIEQDELTEKSLDRYRKWKRINVIIAAIALLAGLLLFAYLLL